MSSFRSLAIFGGDPTISHEVHGRWPQISNSDRKALSRVLDRGIMGGPNSPEIKALEKEYAQYVGVRHCLVTNCGTASLHIALAAVGVGSGGEVIVPAYTFVASALAAAYLGADVVFCDVDPQTYNLDPNELELLITDRTQAILAVHVHGQPSEMDRIEAIGNRYGVPIVEDNSQAHGIRYKGRTTGSLGSTAGASINHSKNLASGEGGLFTTDSDEYYLVARRMALFGEDVPAEQPRRYWSHGLGWNYCGQELVCALARSQLDRLDSYNSRAQEHARYLSAGLSEFEMLRTPYIMPDSESSYWRYAVQIEMETLEFDGPAYEARDRIVDALRAEGVEVLVWQRHPVPAQPVFRREMQIWRESSEEQSVKRWDPSTYPVAAKLCDVTFSLGSLQRPLYVQSKHMMTLYLNAIEKVVANVGHLLRTAGRDADET